MRTPEYQHREREREREGERKKEKERERKEGLLSNKMASSLSTAGAVPTINEKGEMRMQKVKVHRYISGKRPDYAVEKREEV